MVEGASCELRPSAIMAEIEDKSLGSSTSEGRSFSIAEETPVPLAISSGSFR
jgi:hypothetical protein